MRDTVRRLINDQAANDMGTCWNGASRRRESVFMLILLQFFSLVDKQGEIQTVWRNSGVPGLWLQCGNGRLLDLRRVRHLADF